MGKDKEETFGLDGNDEGKSKTDCSTAGTAAGVTLGVEETPSKTSNKMCQSSPSPSRSQNFLGGLLGGFGNNLSGLTSQKGCSSAVENNGIGKGSKSPKISSKVGGVGGTESLFSGLGAKVPVINPSATSGLERNLKTGLVGKEENDTENNNNLKRNSKNLDNVSFLPSTGLPPIPPTTGGSTIQQNIPAASQTQSKPSVVRVSLPTKSSKQGRLKSPSRRKSAVSSPTPVSFEDMSIGSSSGASSSFHHGGSKTSSSGVKKKLHSKRYASSLPDRERCSATSPVTFDLNSYLCHSQGPIDFSSLLSRVHQQQQLLQQHQHQLAAHHQHLQSVPPPPPHIIHHPQATLPVLNQGIGVGVGLGGIPFMGHPKPTKHCKNKHIWAARTSLERELYPNNGRNAPSPTPSNSGENSSSATQQQSSKKFAVGGAALPSTPSNRHSSYHPNFSIGDSTAALQAAAAAAYNAHLLFSRPTSPLYMGDSSASCCGGNSDFPSSAGGATSFCSGCAAKTFPRVNPSSRAAGALHGLCYCCHSAATSANGNGSNANRAQASTPGLSACDGSAGGSLLGLDYEDRLLRLESDKDTLHLQVSVLSDQIEAQTAKISDLEKMLDDKRNVLETTEEQLQRELLLRSSLETQKLELMTEISSLRLKHASLERENIELKDRVVGKSTGDLSFIDGAGPAPGNNSSASSSRIWDKPPIGPERAASPAHSLGGIGGIDPALVAAARARLGSGDHHHQNPPQRTRTPPANAYRRVDQSAFGTIPRRSPHSAQLSANNHGGNLSIFNGGGAGFGQTGTGNSFNGGNSGGFGDFGGGSPLHHHQQGKSGKANSLSSGNLHSISSNFNAGLHQLKEQQKALEEHQLRLFQQQALLNAVSSQKRNKTPFPSQEASWEEGTGLDGGVAFLEGITREGYDPISDNEGEPDGHDDKNDPTLATASFIDSPPSPILTRSPETPSSPRSNLRSSTSGAWAYRKARRLISPSIGGNVEGGSGSSFVSSAISRVFNPRSSSRSTSTPNLVTISDTEQWGERKPESNNGNGNSANNKGKHQSPTGGGTSHKSRGILRILGKLKRSNSGGLDNDVAPLENTFSGTSSGSLFGGGPFVRGGVRATAHPRLGWMKDPSPIIKKPDGPVNSWDSEAVITWLSYLGLGAYSGEVKRWVKSGQQLLDASNHELEKELGIKNVLHRKKLSLALYSLRHPTEEDHPGKLDYHWVIRWLDDVGLPQYKEAFMEAKIDGRVLGHLTAEDLVSLKVSSVLHHASLKRGIQLLRIHKFYPDCLCRRGGPNPGAVSNGGTTTLIGGTSGTNSNGGSGGSNGTSGGNLNLNGGNNSESSPGTQQAGGPKHVATWTNHRVMEWLKAIDLAEYAPNLRGSGVHGALIIFEPRFNSELMATLLAIPGNKTLLRRHLSLQFNELVGRHIVQEKRVAETASDFIPLNPTTKVKIPKKSQFPLRKKRLSTEMSEQDLLCPSDLNSYPFSATTTDSVHQQQITGTNSSLSSVPGEQQTHFKEMSVDAPSSTSLTKTVLSSGEEKVSDI